MNLNTGMKAPAITIGGVVSENASSNERQQKQHKRASRREKEDQEASRRERRLRDKVGSTHSSYDDSSDERRERHRRRDKEDQEAKRRARRIVHSTDDPSTRKTARSSRHDKDGGAKEKTRVSRSNRSPNGTSTRDTGDRKTKEKSKASSRSVTPGAVSVDDPSARTSSHKSRKETEKSKRGDDVRRSTQNRVARERTKALAAPDEQEVVLPATQHGGDEEVILVAEAVDDVEKANLKKLEDDNEELRRQMQATLENPQHDATDSNGDDRTVEQEPPKSDCTRYLCGAFVIIVAIVAGAVAFVMTRPRATIPTSSPTVFGATAIPTSSSQTNSPTFSQLTIDDCLAISEGRPVHNQESLTRRQLNLRFQVSLVEASKIGLYEQEALNSKMNQGPLQTISGCDPSIVASGFRGSRRLTVIDTSVGDAKVAIGNTTALCETTTGQSCFEVEVALLLFLETYESDASLLQLTETVFGKADFAKNAGLPFASIVLVFVEPHAQFPSPNGSQTQSPIAGPSSDPSGGPTTAPSHNPTRVPGALASGAPSIAPSSIPSAGQTVAPSTTPSRIRGADSTESPTVSTSSPTKSPTDPPSTAPTKAPTSNSPTNLPSPVPSTQPSSLPSESPTVAPSSTPSEGPSRGPSNLPSASQAPSTTPSVTPGRCGPLVGGAQCSCDSNYYHCSALGYCGYGADVGAFYVQGEPREYDCPLGPVSLITPAAVVSQSSTRTASNGQIMGPWRAIDGNTDSTDFFTCTQTQFNSAAWWKIDFGFLAKVDKVSIWNIKDSWNRIEGSRLELQDSDGILLFTSNITLGVTRNPLYETFEFSPPIANVASAQLITATNGLPLQLCEFQAYGYLQ